MKEAIQEEMRMGMFVGNKKLNEAVVLKSVCVYSYRVRRNYGFKL